MALQRQLVPQPFSGGLDTKTDEKFVRHPNMLTLKNVTLEDAGRLAKRRGSARLAAPPPGAEALFTHEEQLLSAGDGSLYGYGDSNWRRIGPVQSIKVSAETIGAGDSSGLHVLQSYAATDEFELCTWGKGADVYFGTRDFASGGWAQTSALLQAGLTSNASVHALRVDDTIVVVVVDVVASTHTLYKFTSASTTPVSAYWLTLNAGTKGGGVGTITIRDWVAFRYDDAGIGGGITWGLMGMNKVSTSNIIEFFHIRPSDGFDLDVGAGVSLQTLDCTALTNPAVAAADYFQRGSLYMPPSGGDVRVLLYGSVTAPAIGCQYLELDVSAGTVLVDLGMTATGAAIVGLPSAGAKQGLRVHSGQDLVAVVDSSGTEETKATIYGLRLASKGFTIGTDRYVLLYDTSSLQSCMYLYNCDAQVLASKILYAEAATPRATSGYSLMDVPTIQATKRTAANTVHGESWYYDFDVDTKQMIPRQARVNRTKYTQSTGISITWIYTPVLVSLDTSHTDRYATAQLGKNLHIAGGLIQGYDGKQVFEHGFLKYPEGASAADTGGGALGAGTYAYRVMWEWTDAQGNIHRSAAGPAFTCVTGANRQNTVTYPNYRFGIRTLSDVRVAIYRTVAGGTTVYYRITSITGAPVNSPASATSTYVDNVADSSLTSNETLYVSGGELDNDAPPPSQLLVAGKNRLWCVDEWGDLWFSKEYRPGEAVGFSLFLKKAVPQYGGPITAIGVLDDKIVVFKADRMYVFAGDGPNPLGLDDQFTLLAELPQKVGCPYPLSVVEYDDGLMFKSSKGFYILDRSMNARYVGAGVAAYDDLTVVSAVPLPTLNQIRFAAEDGETLVYDYEQRDGAGLGLWSTFSPLESYDACAWQDRYTMLRTTGAVWQEHALTYDGLYTWMDGATDTDAGIPISMEIETGWFAPMGPQGWKRLYRLLVLGELVSQHTLYVGLAYNYLPDDQYVVSTDLYAEAMATDTSYGAGVYGQANPYGAGGGSEGDLFQFRVSPSIQQCTSVKVHIWDVPSASDGGSCTLSDLTFEVGMTPGASKLSAGRSK